MNKEVELTARLEKLEYNRLHKYLSKNFQKVSSLKRFMVRFFKERVGVREPLDFRYKWTNGINELVIKKGALGSRSREETVIKLGKENELPSFVKLFSMLGFKEMIAVYREIEKFQDEHLEISLITAAPYRFVEVEAINGKTRKEALEHISDFYKKVHLEPLNRRDYQSFLRMLDREVNLAFPISQFPTPLFDSPQWRKIVKTTVFSK